MQASSATFTDLHEVFTSIDTDKSGHIDVDEFSRASARLGFPLRTTQELEQQFKCISPSGKRVSEAQFIEWWNGRNSKDVNDQLNRTLSLSLTSEVRAIMPTTARHEEASASYARFAP